jgi:hypothetical protein
MATTNTLLNLRPSDAVPESAGNPVGSPANTPVSVGLSNGLGYNKSVDSGAVWVNRLPATASFATGATFSLMVADDVNNADPGKIARFAVTVKKLASGTDVVTVAGAGTETTVDLTLPATAGVVLSGTVAIVTANLDGALAGDWVLLRVRRLGTAAADTHRGRVVLLGVEMRDT